MSALASLPMYDWPELRPATDAFWRAISEALRAEGIDAPQALSRNIATEAGWRDPALLLGQCCGWPYATAFRDHLALVAAPSYAAEGCTAGSYSSVIIARKESPAQALADLRGARFAYNGAASQSGVQCVREAIAPLCPPDAPFFASTVESGAHRRSIRMVAAGGADCAAIDALCWHYARRFETEAVSRLRVVHRTRPAPALPFVTARGRAALIPALYRALDEAIAAGAGDALGLTGIAPPDEDGYLGLIARVRNAPPLP